MNPSDFGADIFDPNDGRRLADDAPDAEPSAPPRTAKKARRSRRKATPADDDAPAADVEAVTEAPSDAGAEADVPSPEAPSPEAPGPEAQSPEAAGDAEVEVAPRKRRRSRKTTTRKAGAESAIDEAPGTTEAPADATVEPDLTGSDATAAPDRTDETAADDPETAAEVPPRKRRRRKKTTTRKADAETGPRPDDQPDAADAPTVRDEPRDAGDTEDRDVEDRDAEDRDAEAAGSSDEFDRSDDERGSRRRRRRRRRSGRGEDEGSADDGIEPSAEPRRSMKRSDRMIPVPTPGGETHGQRVAILVDLDPLMAQARETGGEIAFGKLLQKVARRRHLIRAIAYAGPELAAGDGSTLHGSGIDVHTVATDAELPVAMAVDAMALARRVDSVVILPDAARVGPLAAALRAQGVRVETASFIDVDPGADDLVQARHRLGAESLFVP